MNKKFWFRLSADKKSYILPNCVMGWLCIVIFAVMIVYSFIGIGFSKYLGMERFLPMIVTFIVIYLTVKLKGEK